jgi:CspA family cold shock protein
MSLSVEAAAGGAEASISERRLRCASVSSEEPERCCGGNTCSVGHHCVATGAVTGCRSSGTREHTKEETMANGTVKWFNSEKGYGFITPDDGSADVFAHFSEITSQSGFRNLEENQKVEYDLTQGPKGLQASNIRVL